MIRESGLEEDWNMEVEEDDDKKLDEQRRRLQKQLLEIEKFSDTDQVFRDGQKENWKEKLQDIEEKRNELFPEHQKMQKRSRKMQSLENERRNFIKDACACDEEMRKVREEINEIEARYLELVEKSSNSRKEEERRGSCASQSNGCCFDSVMEQLLTLGDARQQIQALQEEFIRSFEVSATPVHIAGREEKRR